MPLAAYNTLLNLDNFVSGGKFCLKISTGIMEQLEPESTSKFMALPQTGNSIVKGQFKSETLSTDWSMLQCSYK